MPFFFFNDTATTEIYTLSLHDALPISSDVTLGARPGALAAGIATGLLNLTGGTFTVGGNITTPSSANGEIQQTGREDRKSTRLNSSHLGISYAVFCL